MIAKDRGTIPSVICDVQVFSEVFAIEQIVSQNESG